MHRLLIPTLIVVLLLAACSADGEDRLSALEGQLETLSAQNADLQARLDAFEAGSGEHAAEATDRTSQAANVAVAQYIMDTAGFHGMEESLAESGEIDPAFLGTVTRVHKVVASTPWPEPLAGQAESFASLLLAFAEALEADDAEAAAGLSVEAHGAQHDFSHTVDNWLGGGDHHD